MGACLQFQYSLTSDTCYLCGIEFAMPTSFRQKRLEDGQNFYCPNGHDQHFTETAVQRLQKLLDAEKRRVEVEASQRRMVESQLSGVRIQLGKKTHALQRLTRRVNAGVCPHCQRTVSQLARHIQTKHPQAVK